MLKSFSYSSPEEGFGIEKVNGLDFRKYKEPLGLKEKHVLLSALLGSENNRDDARRRIEKLSINARQDLGSTIYRFMDVHQPALRNAFREYMVGMQLDDFALGETQKYGGKRILFKLGERSDNAYAVKLGEVVVYDRNKRVLNKFTRGGVFGDFSLMFNVPRTASAVTTLPSELLVITPQEYLEQLESRQKKQIEDNITFARERMKHGAGLTNVRLRREVLELLAGSD